MRFLLQPLSIFCIALGAMVEPALAVDGTVLIDQNRALAGNVTPGDGAGFPVTLSLPGSYRLAGNLTVPAGTRGIDITADDVTLDLNGFKISAAGDFAIRSDRDRVAVRNGTVVNTDTSPFTGAVSLFGAAGTVENIRGFTAGDLGSLFIYAGRDSIVRGNQQSATGLMHVVCPSLVIDNISAGDMWIDNYSGNCVQQNNRSRNMP